MERTQRIEEATAVNLLLGYYTPCQGWIEVDRHPKTPFDQMYSCITVVRQEAVLFHDSLYENLAMYQNIPAIRGDARVKTGRIGKIAFIRIF